MQPDSLAYLGRAIESALEAAAYPTLLALGLALLVVTALDARGSPSPQRSRSARRADPSEGHA
jgi:hypothetical protein